MGEGGSAELTLVTGRELWRDGSKGGEREIGGGEEERVGCPV